MNYIANYTLAPDKYYGYGLRRYLLGNITRDYCQQALKRAAPRLLELLLESPHDSLRTIAQFEDEPLPYMEQLHTRLGLERMFIQQRPTEEEFHQALFMLQSHTVTALNLIKSETLANIISWLASARGDVPLELVEDLIQIKFEIL